MESIIWSRNHKLLYTGKLPATQKRAHLDLTTTTTLDTDSVIFLAPRNQKPPFEEGSMLGQMKNEYPNHDIQAFYSGGFVYYTETGKTNNNFLAANNMDFSFVIEKQAKFRIYSNVED